MWLYLIKFVDMVKVHYKIAYLLLCQHHPASLLQQQLLWLEQHWLLDQGEILLHHEMNQPYYQQEVVLLPDIHHEESEALLKIVPLSPEWSNSEKEIVSGVKIHIQEQVSNYHHWNATCIKSTLYPGQCMMYCKNTHEPYSSCWLYMIYDKDTRLIFITIQLALLCFDKMFVMGFMLLSSSSFQFPSCELMDGWFHA